MNLIKLIETVKKHSKIYKNSNVDDEEYAKEWQKVVKELVRQGECEDSANEAQDRWNEILVEYMEYLRGNTEFAMAKNMDFLQPFLFTIIEDDDALDEVQLLNILADDDIIVINGTPSNNRVDNNDSQKCPNEKKTNAAKTEKNPSDGIHVKEDVEPDKQNTIPLPAPPPVENKSVQNDASFSNLSSMELIFLGYAKQLQKMPLTLQLRTKRKISDIMDEAELNMMEESMKR